MWGCAQEVKREQMEEQQGAAAARPAASMALCTAASLQRALSNDDDDDTMFWDFGPAAGQRGMKPLCNSSFWYQAHPVVTCLATSSSANSWASAVDHIGRAGRPKIMR